MHRSRHLSVGVVKTLGSAVISVVVATMVLSTVLLPWPRPTLAETAVLTVELVSVSSGGTQGNNYGNDSSMSADGRYVAFDSLSSNLVASDTNGTWDVFVRDRVSGETIMVSLNSDNEQANTWSNQPSISADGRYVAFHSSASNLADDDDDGVYDDDTNGLFDVFVRDLWTGVTTRESLSSDNAQNPYNGSWGASISGDGRYVVFTSGSNSMVTPDTNYSDDIFVRDRQTHTTIMVSVATDNTQGNDDSMWSSISADGHYVGFVSHADNLLGAGNDNNDETDVFLHDLVTHETTRVSVANNGDEGNNQSTWFSISPDGRYVAFTSWANNLVTGDTNGNGDVFVRDRQANTTTWVSVTSSGAQVSGNCFAPSISANGRYVAFQSVSDDLVDDDGDSVYDDDTNGEDDMFIHDGQTGETARISTSAGGDQGNNESTTGPTPPGGRYISASGQYVAFRSRATNLLPSATSGQQFFMVQLSVQPDINQPDISVTPTSYDFGSKALGSSSDQTFTVSNNGTDNLTIGTVAGTNPLAAPFSKVTDSCSGQTILPGGSAMLTVRFSPTARGSFSDSFDIPSNDPDTPIVTVALTGATPNAAPTAPVVDVTPDSPTTTADLVCGITTPSTDSDNDTITYTYQWHKGGVAQSGLTTNTVAASSTAKGEVWKCVVTPNDGAINGSPDEDQVTIQNTAPTAPVATVTPESPDGTTDLVCTITSGSTDADGDTITYTYQWYKDGLLQSALTTNTVAAAETAYGQVWRCVVTPGDGTASGPAAEDQVTVSGAHSGPVDGEPGVGMSAGAIVGIVIGVLALKSLFCLFLWFRRKKKKEENQPASPGTPAP